jgi:hypothetical protein
VQVQSVALAGVAFDAVCQPCMSWISVQTVTRLLGASMCLHHACILVGYAVCMCLCPCMEPLAVAVSSVGVLGAHNVHVCVGVWTTSRLSCIRRSVCAWVCVGGVKHTTRWALVTLCTSLMPAVVVFVQQWWPCAGGISLATRRHDRAATCVASGAGQCGLIYVTSPHGVCQTALLDSTCLFLYGTRSVLLCGLCCALRSCLLQPTTSFDACGQPPTSIVGMPSPKLHHPSQHACYCEVYAACSCGLLLCPVQLLMTAPYFFRCVLAAPYFPSCHAITHNSNLGVHLALAVCMHAAVLARVGVSLAVYRS